MIFALRLSIIRKVCDKKVFKKSRKFKNNKLNYTYQRFKNSKKILGLLAYIKNDKKNNDENINFVLLKKIGKTSKPNSQKISLKNLKKISKIIPQF